MSWQSSSAKSQSYLTRDEAPELHAEDQKNVDENYDVRRLAGDVSRNQKKMLYRNFWR